MPPSLKGEIVCDGWQAQRKIHLHNLYGNAEAVAEASYLETANHCRVLGDDELVPVFDLQCSNFHPYVA
jgi:hypothetical protein